MVPTVLDALGLEPLAVIHGVTQSPIQGVSFAHTFNDKDVPSNRHTPYFEMFARRALYDDGWRAVYPFPGPSFTEAQGVLRTNRTHRG
jgi:arylsulfatase